jgi:hypothetical protein
MKRITLYIILLNFLFACSTAPVKDPPSGGNCDLVQETLKLANQTVTLPREGLFVLESHLASKEESFHGSPFPATEKDGIDAHIESSCSILQREMPGIDCIKVYATRYHWEWTPPEGGKAGQGSNGNLKPSLRAEIYSGNMYWTGATKPKIGVNDKFLACKGEKCIVVNAAYETGPGDKKYLGGLQGEPMFYLGATNSTKILWGRLKNQETPLGPIKCLR